MIQAKESHTVNKWSQTTGIMAHHLSQTLGNYQFLIAQGSQLFWPPNILLSSVTRLV